MEEEELEMRSDEIKRIVDDLHEQGLTEACHGVTGCKIRNIDREE